MNLLLKHSVAARAWIVSLGTRGKVALAASSTLLVAGALWLAVFPAGASSLAVGIDIDPQDLDEAAGALVEKGIDARVEQGRVMVPADSVKAAEQILASTGFDETNNVFEDAIAQDSIWSSASQNARRWQAAKMAALGRGIRRFPGVKRAEVLLEEPSPRHGVTEPTAAVQVTLASELAMSPELQQAIVDLLVGSVAGLNPQNVRIVDTAGRSYRLFETADAHGEETQLTRARTAITEQVRAVLSHVPGTLINARVKMRDGSTTCELLWVSLPLSYIQTVASAGRFGDFQAAADACMSKTRSSLAGALGQAEGGIVVDWHYDGLGETKQPVHVTPASMPRWVLPAGGSALLALGLWGGASMLRRRRGRGRSALGVLELASPDDLCEILSQEHPRIISAVLHQLSPAKRISILEAMDDATRHEVERRLAHDPAPDARVLEHVQAALEARVQQFLSQRSSGNAYHAEIDSSVLTGGHDPVGDFAFDDLLDLDDDTLASAVSTLDTRGLAVALRTADTRLSERILNVLDETSAAELTERMESIGPVRLSEVESAQRQVVRALRTGGRYVSHVGERIA